jgi:hypothetical protein
MRIDPVATLRQHAHVAPAESTQPCDHAADHRGRVAKQRLQPRDLPPRLGEWRPRQTEIRFLVSGPNGWITCSPPHGASA